MPGYPPRVEEEGVREDEGPASLAAHPIGFESQPDAGPVEATAHTQVSFVIVHTFSWLYRMGSKV